MAIMSIPISQTGNSRRGRIGLKEGQVVLAKVKLPPQKKLEAPRTSPPKRDWLMSCIPRAVSGIGIQLDALEIIRK